MKFSKIYIAAIAMAMTMVSCEKDGDTIYVDKADGAVLETTATDIALDATTLDALAMTLYWTPNGDITLSDPEVSAPENAMSNTIQFSTDEAFTAPVDDNLTKGAFYRQYSHRDLNGLVSRLGLEAGVEAPVFIRVKSYLAANIEPFYSETLKLNITPYYIDMSTADMLDAGQKDTGVKFFSPENNGIYHTFICASPWYNFYLREANGTLWGNDGVTGTAFVLGNSSTGNDFWNCWFPDDEGCAYTTVDTKANEWSAAYVRNVTLGGDITGEMEYGGKTNVWTFTYNAPAAGTLNVTLSSKCDVYNASTGTDHGAGTAKNMAFGIVDGKIRFGETGSAISLDIPAAGENTIVLDLNDITAITLATGEAPAPVEDAAPMLYLPGATDPWDFETYIRLYDEANLGYAGVNYFKSPWGFQLAVEKDNWTDIYTMVAGGTAFEGKLEAKGKNNIPAAGEGIYFLKVSLSGLWYNAEAVTSVSYTGVNDNWDLHPMTQSADNPCVFTAEYVKTADSQWGAQIIINDNWDLKFGSDKNKADADENGFKEMIFYNGENLHGDNDFADGETVVLTVDFAKAIYKFSKK